MMVKEINKNYLIFPSYVFLNEEYMTTLCTKDHSYWVKKLIYKKKINCIYVFGLRYTRVWLSNWL